MKIFEYLKYKLGISSPKYLDKSDLDVLVKSTLSANRQRKSNIEFDRLVVNNDSPNWADKVSKISPEFINR